MTKTIDTFSPEIPDSDAWPYKRAYSSKSIVYYSLSDEATLPKQDQRFWKAIGKKIKALGMILTKSGCHFVPQSEGQFLSQNELKIAWNSIKTEEKIIRRSGLELTDFDTGESVLFKKNNYRAPWKSFEDFELDVSDKAKIGCIFFLLPQNLKNIEKQLEEKPLSSQYTKIQRIYDIIEAVDPQGVIQPFGLYRINVTCNNESQIEDEWITVTNYIHSLLNSSAISIGDHR